MKDYMKPELEYVLLATEAITDTTGDGDGTDVSKPTGWT